MALLFCALSSSAIAQEDESAWTLLLDSITVKGYRYNSPIKSSAKGVTVWDMSKMNILPQIFGNADPLHYTQTLPGIQTNNEYRSGINIEGCDNQHNAISIEGVPIYNVNHLLGFFSTFNTSHFSSLSIAKGLVYAGSPNRLGGQLEMIHDTETTDSATGVISLGLISSQATTKLPINSKTSITASLRASYINLLYSKWLKANEEQVKYSFYDANVSIVHHLDQNNRLLFDFYCGSDKARFWEEYYMSDMNDQWGNLMGSIHWFYDKHELTSKTTAYVSTYKNEFSLNMKDVYAQLSSDITDLGIKNNITWKRWNAGVECIWHIIHPQSLDYRFIFNNSDGQTPSMESMESSLYANYDYPITEQIKLSEGLRGSIFHISNKTFGALDPSLRLLYDNNTMQLSATYALRHQYLFQTGFSDCGLPTEFWISASNDFKPQYAHELSTSSSVYLFNRRYQVSADLFYRRLYHQLGYKGSVLDYVNTVYDINASLMHGEGESYGLSLMLNKCTGNLTGWVSYTYTHARRFFDGKSYPASHERPHELNAVATYTLDKHWSFGGVLVYASGTPFTAAKSLFLLNNNLIIKYGDYNAARLHPYVRFDLSSNYKWGSRHEQGINLSLYNVTSRDNELFYYLRTNKDGSFVYRPVTFILHVLPSINYYYKF